MHLPSPGCAAFGVGKVGGNHRLFGYAIYGISVESALHLPDLDEVVTGRPDVRVHFGNVPHALEHPADTGFKFQARENQLLIQTRNIADVFVENGDRIIVAPKPHAAERGIRMLLLGWAFAALFHQRGVLPIHGSSICVGEGCVIFCGGGGAGKSTLANVFVQRGYKFLNDNMTVVVLNGKTPMATPGYPEINLFADALRRDENPLSHKRILPSAEKYAVACRDHFCSCSMPIRRIYVLEPGDTPEIQLKVLSPGDKLVELHRHTFCSRFLRGLRRRRSQFQNITQLGNNSRVLKVRSPRAGYPPEDLVNRLEEDFQTRIRWSGK